MAEEKKEEIINRLFNDEINIEEFIEKVFIISENKMRNGKRKIEIIVRENIDKVDRLNIERYNIERYFSEILNYLSKKFPLLSGNQRVTNVCHIIYTMPTLSLKNSYRTMLSEKKVKFVFLPDTNEFKINLGKFSYCGLSNLGLRNLKSFSFVEPLTLEEINKKKLALIKKARFDDVTWSNLKDVKNIEYMEGNKLINITSKFSFFQLEQIKKAFIEKKQINIRNDGDSEKCRDYSVETKMCEDGVFRAWYSSEYHNCGNGDYYLLLNPTQAIFCEKD